MRLLILGYGEMGHALQTLLARHDDVTVWHRSSTSSLEAAVSQKDVIFFCLPVKAHDALLSRIKPLLKPQTVCISIAKGLNAQGQTAAEIFQTHAIARYGLLYGPMLSEELCAHQRGFAQVATSHPDDMQRVCTLFEHTMLFVEPCDDVIGMSWSVIIKNVYALAFGMIDALECGKNVRGFLTVLALRELDTIAHSMGGLHQSSYGLAGLGDLITTGSSTDSHHYMLGYRMAKGDYCAIEGEGINTLAMVKKHARFEWQDYKLFSVIEGIIEQKTSVETGLKSLFKHPIL